MSAQPYKIPVHELDATKKRVHPRFVKGKYQNIRLVSMYFLLALFLILPWIKYDNRQAILFDFADQRFYVFGLTFLPQDFYFFAFFFIISAFALFMVTVYAGRVWCGYACPQTIWTHLYQHVEKWVIGDRNKRIKFDKAPTDAKKIAKRSLIYFIWFIIALITALTFVSYVVGTQDLYFNWQSAGAIPLPNWSGMTLIFIGIFTFATYVNAGYMREHMCTHICPYGRFQSVMFDKDTLIVSYDYNRGEPRGPRKKGTHPDHLGDCIECTMCVQVCPTGIDIRDGLQVECIQCAACVDACNEIMDKVGYPRGLIRYTTERQLVENEDTKILSWRIFAYSILLAGLIGILLYTLTDRVPLEIDIRRDRNQLSSMNAQGLIENSYIVKITNKTQDKHNYTIAMEPQDGLSLQLRFNELPLDPGESYDMPVSIYGDPAVINKGQTPVTLTVTSEDGTYSVSKENIFTTQGQ
ncbi:cytochrome c oxidase accessory protein CcoG [Psychrobacter pygoscelis]|uniref:cytochrome c oxidase accessory protein CcoG n=1 Tax=Psychrobacter pygoscelis TaxID=2488563 RepID=UPI00103BE621|nr:cytochrome c oxidase accessory protein CcoG [Psychrobacter pygoscelis]